MKKVFVTAVLVISGWLNAGIVEPGLIVITDEKVEKEKIEKESNNGDDDSSKMQCFLWTMYVWCTEEYIGDTVCWGAGSGTATHAQAVANEIHNSQLLTEYICGIGTGSGWGTGNSGH